MAAVLGGPDERKRDEWEGRLTRLVSSTLAKRFADLKDRLGDGTELPDVFWQEFETDLHEAIVPTLEEIAKHSAGRTEAQVAEEQKAAKQQIVIQMPEPVENDSQWLGIVKSLLDQQATAIKANADAITELAKAMANQPAPQVHVEPASVTVEAPAIVMPETTKAVPVSKGPVSRHEQRRLVRDQRGTVLGSEVDVQYDYEE
jgi:hypothetical protein